VTPNVEFLIKHLNLQPLPQEGGFFSETDRSEIVIRQENLCKKYNGDRNLATTIFYLLTPETCSALHRLPGDEIFHFYLGDPVEMLQLHPDGTGNVITLGQRLEEGMKLQVFVPGQSWQGARLVDGGIFALMGTTMAPGFDFQDFEAARRSSLVNKYPLYSDQISKLTGDG
jgi:predicted cupin superfamily sugar epimerase